MAILPLPQRGQPIDYDYLYNIAEAINTLSSVVAASSSSGNIIDVATGSGNTRTNVSTSNTKIVAKKQDVPIKKGSKGYITTGFEVSFGEPFGATPVVTVSPKPNTANDNVTIDLVVITEITKASVKGFVKTTASGAFTVELQVIAIGVKN